MADKRSLGRKQNTAIYHDPFPGCVSAYLLRSLTRSRAIDPSLDGYGLMNDISPFSRVITDQANQSVFVIERTKFTSKSLTGRSGLLAECRFGSQIRDRIPRKIRHVYGPGAYYICRASVIHPWLWCGNLEIMCRIRRLQWKLPTFQNCEIHPKIVLS
ncbi:hypothetical protein AVEN_80800-1 [Araneus ventricosus]|uniref:Uncharacterized protein n=1 Tax=Araneus ventricosus TaxID=182803 RepID=A0A4Y2FH63_ARAVE|nr:hypothetical protein AVEN_80800-1 [Araneus ventricosus]